MSDANKAEKLAAARKKLKEFQNQQKNKENHADQSVHQTQSSVRGKEPVLRTDSFTFHEPITTKNHLEESDDSEAVQNHANLQKPSLANYFQNSSRHEFIFDVAPKHTNGDLNHAVTEAFLPAKPEIPPASSFFSQTADTSSLPTFNLFPTSSDSLTSGKEPFKESKLETVVNEEAERLKQELQTAESKIKMQAGALDVVTAEREELQTKLIKSMEEIAVYRDKVASLHDELGVTFNCQKELNDTVAELKRLKDDTLARDLAFEKSLNDLKEENDELRQSLEIQKERNNLLQSQLEESKSHYDMLSLKFQQLGIETGNDEQHYRTNNDECELWKHKHAELEERLKTMVFEREHTNDEYRQFVDNLKSEIQQGSYELQRLSAENQVLVEKISSQTEHISSLERQLQKPLPSSEENRESIAAEFLEEIALLKRERENDKRAHEQLLAQLADYDLAKQRTYELERELENLKTEVTDTSELQMAVESNKVAASQAISQNNKLKYELERLNQVIELQSNEKAMLSDMLEQERVKNEKLTKTPVETQLNDGVDIETNDAAMNTDTEIEGVDGNVHGKANLDAMLQLQEKFKSVLDRMADLTDEKQQLEHLVLQLQCETETIEEYVALYQKQRSVLQQRARETDSKMEHVSQEKERLLNIIRSILTTNEFDCSFVKQLVERNLSSELSDELAQNLGSNLSNGQSYSFYPLGQNDTSEHHPSCPCCSGKLITV